MNGRPFALVLLASMIAAAVAASPASAGTRTEQRCVSPNANIPVGYNCGSVTLSLEIDNASCEYVTYSDGYKSAWCDYTLTATATATAWVTPGSLHSNLQTTAMCSGSLNAAWNAVGAVATKTCTGRWPFPAACENFYRDILVEFAGPVPGQPNVESPWKIPVQTSAWLRGDPSRC